MAPRHAALVEFEPSHEECLYAQHRFLSESGFEVSIVAHESLADALNAYPPTRRTMLAAFGRVGAVRRWRELLRVRRFLLDGGVSHVVFNTAHNHWPLGLAHLPFPRRVRFAGTIHNLEKLRGSTTQRLITRRVSRYFVLGDYLLDALPATDRSRVASFYPIFFPPIDPGEPIRKPPGETWIAIPGQVEHKRRDYATLLDALPRVRELASLRFVLLGPSRHRHGDGEAIERALAKLGVTSRFTMWNDRVDDVTYQRHMAACDFVLPLIHPHNPYFDDYRRSRISGSFNQAFGHRTPLIMHRAFTDLEDFAENAVAYDTEELGATLDAVARGERLPDAPYAQVKWTFEAQRERYVRHLLGDGPSRR